MMFLHVRKIPLKSGFIIVGLLACTSAAAWTNNILSNVPTYPRSSIVINHTQNQGDKTKHCQALPTMMQPQKIRRMTFPDPCQRRQKATKLQSVSAAMSNAALTSLLAGSIAGAVGVGVAYPLDTLKTKQQVLGANGHHHDNMFLLIKAIFRTEGIGGFFGGVKAMMLGQAILKSVAFTTNSTALRLLQERLSLPFSTGTLILAACISGFLTSFLVVPIERIKVMMQAQNKMGQNEAHPVYQNELQCIKAILRAEGFNGFMFRGLGPTILREIPSFAIYFVMYGVMIQSTWLSGKSWAPFVAGASAGCASWLPVYPIDVVKTIVQNTENSTISTWNVTQDLFQTGGVGAFFDGITPKLLRAAVNHAVTFSIYDTILAILQSA